jgi:hypothetical protein
MVYRRVPGFCWSPGDIVIKKLFFVVCDVAAEKLVRLSLTSFFRLVSSLRTLFLVLEWDTV